MGRELYVILLEKVKPFTPDVIDRHVTYLRQLGAADQLRLCGLFRDYPGGMLIVHADSRQSAESIAQADPFVAEGFETCQVKTLDVFDEWESSRT